MSDGPVAPSSAGDDDYDYKDDCLRHRVPPGDGTFAVDDLVTLLLDLGVGPAVGSRGVQRATPGADPPLDTSTACATGMRAVLERCLAARAARLRLDRSVDRLPKGDET